MISSKTVNFYHTEAGLTLKWSRILPPLHWCYQNQSNCTAQRRTTLRNLLHDRQAATIELYSKVALARKQIRKYITA